MAPRVSRSAPARAERPLGQDAAWTVKWKVELTRRTLRIPFHTPSHALVAQRALSVDKEQNAQLVKRQIEVDGSDLVV